MWKECPPLILHHISLWTLLNNNAIYILQIIGASSEILSEKLRYDESSSDLEDRLRTPAEDNSEERSQYSTGYFIPPNTRNTHGQAIEHSNFVQLPSKVLEQYGNVECASFMGLIPEVHRWRTFLVIHAHVKNISRSHIAVLLYSCSIAYWVFILKLTTHGMIIIIAAIWQE